MTDNTKQYIGHDIEALDDAGNYYSRHVNAMTAENLFSKSDIAAELGYRDKRIDELLAALEELKAKTSTCMGVGNGSGNLFVYGDYDSIKAAQRIVLDSEKLRAALEEKDQELDKEGDILIDTQESMREWRQRANAAEQREEHLKATVDVLSAKNAELEQRLQQPIKLRSRVFEMMNVGGGHSIQVVSVKTVKEIIRAAGFKIEVEGE